MNLGDDCLDNVSEQSVGSVQDTIDSSNDVVEKQVARKLLEGWGVDDIIGAKVSYRVVGLVPGRWLLTVLGGPCLSWCGSGYIATVGTCH